MKRGDMVTNLGGNSRSKLFSTPLSSFEPRRTVGLLIGVGVVLDLQGSDVRILNSEGVAGWTFVGNLRCLNETW